MLSKVVSRVLPGHMTLVYNSQCFYCKKPINDKKHSDRKNFEISIIIKTKIYTSTLEFCREREDNGAKKIECRLLGISEIVAAEARYLSVST